MLRIRMIVKKKKHICNVLFSENAKERKKNVEKNNSHIWFQHRKYERKSNITKIS